MKNNFPVSYEDSPMEDPIYYPSCAPKHLVILHSAVFKLQKENQTVKNKLYNRGLFVFLKKISSKPKCAGDVIDMCIICIFSSIF